MASCFLCRADVVRQAQATKGSCSRNIKGFETLPDEMSHLKFCENLVHGLFRDHDD